MMRVDQTIAAYSKQLQAAGITSARLDCLILLEDLTKKDRTWLLAHPEATLDDKTLHDLRAAIQRRSTHEPLAYIRHQTEFYGRTFYVDQHVLEPRPESEAIIEAARQLAATIPKSPSKPAGPVIIDVGTGSGALAISAALAIPKAKIYATDIDQNCLAVATRNAAQHRVAITFMQADLLRPTDPASPLPKPDIILANLPYVPDNFAINAAAQHEPSLAIFGGPDGLDLYRRMFDQIDSSPTDPRPRYVITESLPLHHEQLAEIAHKAGYKLRSITGFVQVFGINHI